MSDQPPGRLDHIAWWAWLTLLAAVPVTSFPLVEATIGGETVSPLSLIPLLLLVIWIARYVRRGGKLPTEVRPLLLFGVLAALSSVVGLALPLGPYKGQTTLTRAVHGMSTVGIGLCFYLSAVILPSDRARMRSSLKALYVGGVLTLLWASAQATYVLAEVRTVPWAFNRIHRLFSVRDLFHNRVTGLAYEPSWLGDQLVVLYLPLWLAALASGYSVIRTRGRVPVLELALALWGIVVLLLAESRISVAGLLAMLGLVAAWQLWRLAGWLASRIPVQLQQRLPLHTWLPRVLTLGIGLLLFAALVRGILDLSATTDWRIRRVLGLSQEIAALRAEHPYEWIYAVADRAAFAERVVYWRAGLYAFERYPLLGVGMGNAGFLFEPGLPTYGHRLAEIRNVMSPDNTNFPNPKGLWIRLLAETGVIGTSAFLSWFVLMLAGSFMLARTSRRDSKLIGLAGLLAWPAWLLEGFSLDTFALPQTWLIFGLLAAVIWRERMHLQPIGEVLRGPISPYLPGAQAADAS